MRSGVGTQEAARASGDLANGSAPHCETTSRTSVASRRAAGPMGRGTYIANAM